MKQKYANILFGLLFLIGFGILVYPTVADQWNTYRQSLLISSYESIVSEANDDTLEKAWNEAYDYNEAMGSSNVYNDAFDDEEDLEDSTYWHVLNLNNDGVMGYITIPKIDIEIPIYHGTSSEVLENGAGHLSGSQLPIGGSGNHSVIAAHRGLPTSKLFTDLDELEIGDVFYLTILNETLAYEVDQILTFDKDDSEGISEALSSVEGEDYVTLFTCTPYGVNTHRLLVRGSRVDYVEEDIKENTVVDSIKKYYMFYLIIGLVVTFVVIMIIRRKIRRGE
ncbi:MAG: class C sortase [Erysipelotrichaceae bacterium]|nr:class C sortase [Erysipelotrichaceae bacterium]